MEKLVVADKSLEPLGISGYLLDLDPGNRASNRVSEQNSTTRDDMPPRTFMLRR